MLAFLRKHGGNSVVTHGILVAVQRSAGNRPLIERMWILGCAHARRFLQHPNLSPLPIEAVVHHVLVCRTVEARDDEQITQIGKTQIRQLRIDQVNLEKKMMGLAAAAAFP
jgi:hypothetical protein